MSSDRAATAAARPIPTPLRVRWSLFRSRWLPVFTMGVCALFSIAIWNRVAAVGQALGEVERVKVELSSIVEGRLDYVNGKQVRLLQHVDEGDVIAKLDDSTLQTQITAATADLQVLKDQLKAASAGGAEAGLAERAPALRAAIASKEEHLATLDGKLDALVIKAPITGTVTAIHARPGQFVQAGKPIMEIAAEQGASIMVFLKAEQRILPREGMEVEVRTSSDPYHAFSAKVESVAGQYDALPTRLLRDAKTPEWGIPVRVTIPTDASVKPGELVRVTFRARPAPSETSGSAVAVANPARARHEPRADAAR